MSGKFYDRKYCRSKFVYRSSFLMTAAGCSWRRRPLLTQLVKSFIGQRREIWEKEIKGGKEKKLGKDENKTILQKLNRVYTSDSIERAFSHLLDKQ